MFLWILCKPSIHQTYISTSWLQSGNMSDDGTSISVKEPVRDELRRYKADDGLTYDEAIARLLERVDWIEDENELLQKIEE
jgi:hypothetical protein